MPEVPETTIMTDQLRNKFLHSLLLSITILSGRYRTHGLPAGLHELRASLPQEIKKINNKGKFVYIVLNNKHTIWITLGLTGHLTTNKSPKYARIQFKTNHGSFYLNDMRNFGTLVPNKTLTQLHNKLESLGPDPLTNNFTFKEFQKQFQKQLRINPRQSIATLLLKQNFVAGIGNYLRSEIIYDLRLHPLTPIQEISSHSLFKSIKKIARQSYKHQQNHGLHTYDFKVYKRKKDPYNNPINSLKIGTRTVWFVPSIIKY